MQETIAAILLGAVFGGVLLVFVYMLALTAFFKELQQKEPEIWHEIGAPTLWNMLLTPYIHPHKYYAFRPKLKERIHRSDYLYARKAHFLLKAGLVYCGLIFALAALLGFTL